MFFSSMKRMLVVVITLMEYRILFLKVELSGHSISSSTIENFVVFFFSPVELMEKIPAMIKTMTMNHSNRITI